MKVINQDIFYHFLLGFTCKKYSKLPKARLYIMDELIDEFYIEECSHDEPYNLALRHYYIRVPKEVKETDIIIEVDNNDNNFNNGFMTRLTTVMLQTMWLLPAETLPSSPSAGAMLWGKINPPLDPETFNQRRSFKHALKVLKNRKFSVLNDRDHRHNKIYELNHQTSWTHTEGDDQGISHSPGDLYERAGSGFYKVSLYKKYGVLIPKNVNPPWKIFTSHPTQLLDKVYRWNDIQPPRN